MRKSDIQVGKAYTDHKGAIRLIVAEGPEYTLYNGQAETDNLQYLVLAKIRGKHRVGDRANCTRASMAAWAKAEVPGGEWAPLAKAAQHA